LAYEEFLKESQISPEDVVGAYGFNMLAACPSLGGRYFLPNMLPCCILDSNLSDMGFGCCTPLWYNPGSCFCGTMAGPCGCCEGPAQAFAKGDAKWGSPNLALRSQFEMELRGESMTRELANAESEADFRKRFCCERDSDCIACCKPLLDKQAVHLNDTWAKDVNERLLKPAGYFCVLRSWDLGETSHGNSQGGRQSSFLQLLIVKGDEEAMKRMKAVSCPPTTTEMKRGQHRGAL
jgi:hypothetical protein